jgi:LysM repeat protein
MCLVFAASLALVGCTAADKQEAQTDDAGNPHYKAAQEDIDNHNPHAAVAEYEAALDHNPKLAGAHYKLGLIYGDQLNDPVGAIYHFRRFLALTPNSDKADEVKGLVDKESQAFAASLPNSPAQNANDYAQLQGENAALKKQVDDATRTIAQLQSKLTRGGRHHGQVAMQSLAPDASSLAAEPARGPTPVIPVSTDAATPDAVTNASAPAAPAAAPQRATAVDTNAPDVNAAPPAATNGAPAAPAGPSKNYTVVKGDSIWRIAHKMYPGDTKNGEDKILGANPGLDPKRLKIGQTLVIPQ